MFHKIPTTSVIVMLLPWTLMSARVSAEDRDVSATAPGHDAPAAAARTDSQSVEADAEPHPGRVEQASKKPQNGDDGEVSDPPTSPPTAITAEGMTFESLRPELLEKWNKIRTFSATVQSITIYGASDERFSRRGDGRYDYMKKDGKELVRMIENNLHTVHRPEGDGTTRETIDSLLDGEYGYVVTERSGRYRAAKYDSDKAMIMRLGGLVYLDMLSDSYDIKVLPTELVNDRPAWVFEATPKGTAAKLYHYVDQATGIAVKTAVTNERAPSELTVTVSNIQLDVTFDDDRFRFHPPPGVTVVDESEAVDSSPADPMP